MKRPRGPRVPAKGTARQGFTRQDFTAKTSRRERGRAFEVAAAPVHADDGPAVRERAVLKVERRARALQQCLGDEEAKPQAARLAVAAPAATVGDIGLADPVPDLPCNDRPLLLACDGAFLT